MIKAYDGLPDSSAKAQTRAEVRIVYMRAILRITAGHEEAARQSRCTRRPL